MSNNKISICENLNKLINILDDIILSINKDLNIISVNNTAALSIGYKSDEISGKNIKELFSQKQHSTVEELFKNYKKETYKPKSLKLVCKTGQTIDVQVIIEELEADEQSCIIVVCKKNYKENLPDDWFNTYITNQYSSILLTNSSTGEIINAAECSLKIFGYTHDEIIGKSVAQLRIISEEQHKQIVELFNINSEIEKQYITVKTKSGDEKSVVYSAKRIINNNIQYALIKFSDATAYDFLRKKYEEREAFLFMLFDIIQSAIIVYEVKNRGETGNDYIIKDMNKKAMEYENVSLEDVRGKSIINDFGIIKIFEKVWKTGNSEFYPMKAYKENGEISAWYENRIFKLKTGELVAVYDNVTKRVLNEKKLNERLSVEIMFRDLAIWGLENITLDDFLNKGLKLIGNTLNSSRVCIVMNDKKNNTISNTHEWTNVCVPLFDKFQNINIKNTKWIIDKLSANEIISFDDTSKISDKDTRDIMKEHDIKSITLLPLFVAGKFYGYMSFDECKLHHFWQNAEMSVLMTVSSIFSEVITRHKIENALAESEFMMRSQFDCGEIGIIIKDRTGNILHVNKKATDIMQCTQEEYKKLDCIKSTHPDDLQESLKFYEDLKAGRIENYQHQKRLIRKDGSLVHVILTGSCYKDNKGAVSLVFLTMQDITEQKRMEAALFSEKEQLRVTLKSIGDGVITTDKDKKITMINTIAEEMTGWIQKEALNHQLSEVFDIYDSKIGEIKSNAILKCKDGSQRLIADSAAPIKSANGEIMGFVLVFRDITEEKKRNDEMIHLSQHDALTGLYNRRYFEESLKKFDKQGKYPISVIMGDLNGLKITNDVFGHDAGDSLLISISDVLKKHARKRDIVARWGGDEYVILMPNTENRTARRISKQIQKTCGEYRNASSCKITPLSISLGYATHETRRHDIMQVVRSAEDFMSKTKLLESRSAHNSIISSIKQTLFEKSHETEEHANRLKELCNKMGESLGLSDQQLNDLELFAMLHDIGKITIDDTILAKSGKLTDEEWKIIKRHPATGYRITQSAPELTHIADLILTHHERWDGGGYPHNIKGENIPMLSRILSIADAYDALTSERPYSKAIPKDIAIQEIKDCANGHFDPNIVEVFLKVV